MDNPYSLKKLREIYKRVGGEDGGRPLYEFFNNIDNGIVDEHAALIKLATALAEQNEQLVQANMSLAEQLPICSGRCNIEITEMEMMDEG